MEYESNDDAFPAEGYAVNEYAGVAWYARGWEVEPDDDTEWSGIKHRTGRVVMTMIGDDRYFAFDLSDIVPLNREEYCGNCGQLGCTHDGLDRS